MKQSLEYFAIVALSALGGLLAWWVAAGAWFVFLYGMGCGVGVGLLFFFYVPQERAGARKRRVSEASPQDSM